MSKKYKVKDQFGREIGTIDPDSPTDQAVGLALFIYLFWKPLVFLAVVIGIIVTPIIIVQGIAKGIDDLKTRSENPGILARYNQDIRRTVEQGFNVLNASLRRNQVDANISQYFSDEAVADISKQINSFRQRNQTIDQTITMNQIQSIRLLDARKWDTTKMAEVVYACISTKVSGTRIVKSPDNIVAEYPGRYSIIRVSLKRTGEVWRIIEIWDAGVSVTTWENINSYCRD